MSERTRVPDVRVLLLTTGPRANVRSKFFPFSNEILLTGAGRRKFKGKAEGWWRLARFFLIVRSQTSLASFAVPSATRELWRWKGSRQIGPWQIGPSHVNPDKLPRTGHLMKVTCCARGGTTCRFFQRPAVRISPGSRSLLPSLGSGSPKLVTLVWSAV